MKVRYYGRKETKHTVSWSGGSEHEKAQWDCGSQTTAPIRCVDQASQIYQDQSEEGYTHVDLVRRQTFSVAVFVQGLFWPHMATITNHRFNLFHIPPDRTLHSLQRLNNRLQLQSLSFVAKIAAWKCLYKMSLGPLLFWLDKS
jgi:hypothetical protein